MEGDHFCWFWFSLHRWSALASRRLHLGGSSNGFDRHVRHMIHVMLVTQNKTYRCDSWTLSSGIIVLPYVRFTTNSLANHIFIAPAGNTNHFTYAVGTGGAINLFFLLLERVNHTNLYKNLIKIQISNVNLGAIGARPLPAPLSTPLAVGKSLLAYKLRGIISTPSNIYELDVTISLTLLSRLMR